jgi:hypothetical protein
LVVKPLLTKRLARYPISIFIQAFHAAPAQTGPRFLAGKLKPRPSLHLSSVVLLLLLVVALLLFSSVSSEKVEENPRYHEKEDKYDPEESLTARTQIYRTHSFSSYWKLKFFSVLSIIRVKTNIGDTRGNQSGPKSGTGHLEKSPGTDGSTKYTTNFNIQQRKTREPPKRKWVWERKPYFGFKTPGSLRPLAR